MDTEHKLPTLHLASIDYGSISTAANSASGAQQSCECFLQIPALIQLSMRIKATSETLKGLQQHIEHIEDVAKIVDNNISGLAINFGRLRKNHLIMLAKMQ